MLTLVEIFSNLQVCYSRDYTERRFRNIIIQDAQLAC